MLSGIFKVWKLGMGYFLGLVFGPGIFSGSEFYPHSTIPVIWHLEYPPPPWIVLLDFFVTWRQVFLLYCRGNRWCTIEYSCFLSHLLAHDKWPDPIVQKVDCAIHWIMQFDSLTALNWWKVLSNFGTTGGQFFIVLLLLLHCLVPACNLLDIKRFFIKPYLTLQESIWLKMLSCLGKVILKAWRLNIKKLWCAIAIQACESIAKETWYNVHFAYTA